MTKFSKVPWLGITAVPAFLTFVRKYVRKAELTKEVLVGGQVITSPIFNQIVIRDVVSKKMYLVIRDHLLVRT